MDSQLMTNIFVSLFKFTFHFTLQKSDSSTLYEFILGFNMW